MITGKDIRGALNYNESKVLQGKASCIQANLFLKEVNRLTFYDKLNRFMDLNEKNKRTRTNTLHISLNFAPGEKLGPERLSSIASSYMDKIGFGNQPYLVYEHTDAAHPHVHILTTLIRQDGNRINVHYLGKNESAQARREIEKEFGLAQAGGKRKGAQESIHPVDVAKVLYGKSETRRSVANIVRMITRSYKYTSLPELNAVLRQFNVTADRGTEGSRMFRRKGLLYSLIDENGKRVGRPVKASSIYGKPTLSFLEKQFRLNEALRQPWRDPVKRSIDKALLSPGIRSPKEFSGALAAHGIAVIFRTNAEGRTYGVTFVDNRMKVVFNGSDLGKAYSAKAIMEKLSMKPDTLKLTRPELAERATQKEQTKIQDVTRGDLRIPELMRDLLTAEHLDHSSPEAALRLRRKRKRKGRKL